MRDRVGRLLLAGALLALAGSTVARAGDYHSETTLRCNDCHVMHYSQSHDYGLGGVTQLGSGGPFRSLLRNPVNELCLACHDGNVQAADVLGAVNTGSQAATVRSAGYLNSVLLGGATTTGHTLESLDEAPGSQPSWTAQTENGFGVGLRCTNCHDPHGSPGLLHPTGSQYRNLRSDVGYATSAWVTYNHDLPGSNDLTRDIFLRQPLAFDESRLDWNEPDSNRTAIARWCAGCHTTAHGESPGGGSGGGGGGGGLPEHPVEGENLESDMLARYNSLTNRVKVTSEIGAWFPAGSDVTPTCITCHRAHGNGNRGGLIFRSGTGTPTEDGDTNGTAQGDLCRQCHSNADPG